MEAPSATPQPGQPAAWLSAAHWCERPPKQATPSTVKTSQTTAQQVTATVMLGRARRMDVVSRLSSGTRGTTRKIRSAEKEASVRAHLGEWNR